MEIEPNLLQEQIEKAKKGKQTAFNFLLDSFWNDVYGFQLKRTSNEHDAEDVTIQTFSRAFDKIDTFDPNYTFKTWLITISKNIHVDLVRKKMLPFAPVPPMKRTSECIGSPMMLPLLKTL